MIENSYNEYLKEKIFELFPKKEAASFMEECEKSRPTTIRVNRLLKNRKDVAHLLGARGMDLENLEWCEDGMVVFRSQVPLGATPEYLAGYYIIQGASSMLPVLNLELSGEGDLRVLDMCSSPGGKSSHIASLMGNSGIIFSNDINKERIVSLKSNLQRMSVRNCIVTNYDARNIDFGSLDRVLLDAPCSGTGIISKDPSVKMSRSSTDIRKLTTLQRELILKGFDMLKPGGVMVYSTCSILPSENEEIVAYLLRKRKNAKIADLDVDVGKEGLPSFRGKTYHGELKKARRVYPHVHNMDGFFYVKIRRVR